MFERQKSSKKRPPAVDVGAVMDAGPTSGRRKARRHRAGGGRFPGGYGNRRRRLSSHDVKAAETGGRLV